MSRASRFALAHRRSLLAAAPAAADDDDDNPVAASRGPGDIVVLARGADRAI